MRDEERRWRCSCDSVGSSSSGDSAAITEGMPEQEATIAVPTVQASVVGLYELKRYFKRKTSNRRIHTDIREAKKKSTD